MIHSYLHVATIIFYILPFKTFLTHDNQEFTFKSENDQLFKYEDENLRLDLIQLTESDTFNSSDLLAIFNYCG